MKTVSEYMYILPYSLKFFKTKYVSNTDQPHSLGPVIIHLTGWFGYKDLSFVYIHI